MNLKPLFVFVIYHGKIQNLKFNPTQNFMSYHHFCRKVLKMAFKSNLSYNKTLLELISLKPSDALKALGVFYSRQKGDKMGKKIYVANIPFDATGQDITNLFSDYGEVVSVKIITDKFTGQSKGFGFVEMGSESDAKNTISELNGKPFMGKTLTLAEARPQQPRAGFHERKGGFSPGTSSRKGWR
jgi:RNA recognition motif-containing protein